MLRLALPLALIVLAGPAFAHPGHEHTLIAGALHPFSGLDHIAAMIAVGLVAFTVSPQRLWLAPVLFLAGLGGGALAARFDLVMPAYEQAILASLVVLGLIAAFGRAVPLVAAGVLLVAFGAAHGAAHAVEAPAGAFTGYMAGFLIASAVLHALGLGAGFAAQRLGQPLLVRLGGALVALTGLALAFGA